MPAQQYTLPVEGAVDKDGTDITSVWAPGTGSMPVLGGFPLTVAEAGALGSVTAAAIVAELGGNAYQNCPAATAQVVKGSAGRLCKVIVLATGTAAVSIYDNPSAASGQIIFTVPANAANATIYDLYIKTTLGIYVAGAANTPQLLCTFA